MKVAFIRKYLQWVFARYIHREVVQEKQSKIAANMTLRLTTFFESLSFPSGFIRKKYKSLSEQEVVYVLEVVHPDCQYNPFQPLHRLRNYLIVKLFLSTGIRLGEILLLKSTSLFYSEDSYYLQKTCTTDETDSRADRPDIKNTQSERFVAITKELYELCDYYILHQRRFTRNGKRMKLKHGFLFTSELGKPLSKTAISDIFGKINSALNARNKPILINISPHALRHTFADSFLQYLIDVRKMDMERAKDEL